MLLEHRGMVNHHAAVARMFELGPTDRVLQFALLGFDICLEEMFPTWLTGGAVVFRSDVIGGREFLTWLERNQITIMDVPTAFWHEWVHDLHSLNARPPDSLRLLIVGGEKASRSVYSLWRQIVRPSVRWLNTYGPTEATIIATAYEPAAVADDERLEIPIGRPIANAQIYILDKQMKPVPVGVPGELFIGGAGVARGYLHRLDLSAQKFVPNPFIAGGRLYATGDLARFRSDGNIEFAGRTDDQLKIRGFRVEPGEIEAVLTQQPGVQQAVVIGTSGANAKLVAYVVPMTNATSIRSHSAPRCSSCSRNTWCLRRSCRSTRCPRPPRASSIAPGCRLPINRPSSKSGARASRPEPPSKKRWSVSGKRCSIASRLACATTSSKSAATRCSPSVFSPAYDRRSERNCRSPRCSPRGPWNRWRRRSRARDRFWKNFRRSCRSRPQGAGCRCSASRVPT